MLQTAVYPGTFDPLTRGHLDIIQRACCTFGRVIVAVSNNPAKSPTFSVAERIQMVEGSIRDLPNADVDTFAGLLVEYLKTKKIPNLVVVSPDVGGLKMAHAYSQTMEAGLAIVAKRRKNASEVESIAVIGDVRNQNVLMVDDLTETAGTLTTAAALLKKKGAKRIIACVSHAILNDVGIERLRKSAVDELITTDTVSRPAIPGANLAPA